jgi:hypothetical protein
MKRVWALAMLAGLWMGCHTTTKSENQAPSSTVSTSDKGAVASEGASGSAQSAPAEVAQIAFETMEHDFGKIREGEKVTHRFKFKNTGKVPLKITDVKPSCGCTASDYTKEPVPPGGEGYVEVVFDSQGRTGTQQKTVTVFANTDPPSHILRFKGEVIPAKQ